MRPLTRRVPGIIVSVFLIHWFGLLTVIRPFCFWWVHLFDEVDRDIYGRGLNACGSAVQNDSAFGHVRGFFVAGEN